MEYWDAGTALRPAVGLLHNWRKPGKNQHYQKSNARTHHHRSFRYFSFNKPDNTCNNTPQIPANPQSPGAKQLIIFNPTPVLSIIFIRRHTVYFFKIFSIGTGIAGNFSSI